MDFRDLRLRGWFGDIEIQCRLELETGQCPDWLKEEMNQGRVGRAVRHAGLPRSAEIEVCALTLGIFKALQASMPRPNAAVRKEVQALIKRIETLRYLLEPTRIKSDVTLTLWGDFSSEDQPSGPIDLCWGYDACADLRAALDLFLGRARTVDMAAHQGGARPAVTTLAAIGLVGLALTHAPHIEAMPLAGLAERVLNRAIDAYEELAGKQVARPDWHDRISYALAERRDGEK